MTSKGFPMKSDLTADYVRSILFYSPDTGVFTWIDKGVRKDRLGEVAGYSDPKKKNRVSITIGCKRYFAHRLAWLYMTGEWPKNVIDHKDCDPSNNRWSNLRDVTTVLNNQNRKKPNAIGSSGVLGASTRKPESRGKPFIAQISVDNRNRYIGSFDTAQEAGLAYLDAKKNLHPGALENT